MKARLSALVWIVSLSGCAEKPSTEGAIKEGAEIEGRVLEPVKRSFDPAVEAATTVENGSGESPLLAAKRKAARDAAERALKPVAGREPDILGEILAMPDGDAKVLALKQLFGQWAASDLEAAMQQEETMIKDTAMKRAFYGAVAPFVAETDPGRLLQIIGDGNWWPDQWESEREAMRNLEIEDFQSVREFFAATAPGKQHKEEAYRYPARIAEEESVESAVGYAEAFENPAARAWATRAAIGRWVDEDSLDASQYAASLQDPVVRDQAVLGLVDGIWQTNPKDSVKWAQSIKNPELRQSAYVNLARSWQGMGSTENVDHLLNGSGLSEQERAAIQGVLPTGDTE